MVILPENEDRGVSGFENLEHDEHMIGYFALFYAFFVAISSHCSPTGFPRLVSGFPRREAIHLRNGFFQPMVSKPAHRVRGRHSRTDGMNPPPSQVRLHVHNGGAPLHWSEGA